jgi:hypothetical protein
VLARGSVERYASIGDARRGNVDEQLSRSRLGRVDLSELEDLWR